MQLVSGIDLHMHESKIFFFPLTCVIGPARDKMDLERNWPNSAFVLWLCSIKYLPIYHRRYESSLENPTLQVQSSDDSADLDLYCASTQVSSVQNKKEKMEVPESWSQRSKTVLYFK